jgi:hypothetical protein
MEILVGALVVVFVFFVVVGFMAFFRERPTDEMIIRMVEQLPEEDQIKIVNLVRRLAERNKGE